MAEEVLITITVDDRASAALKSTEAATEGLADAQGKSNEASREGTKVSAALSKGFDLVKAGAIGVAVEAGLMVAKLGAVVGVSQKLLNAFREQDKVARNVKTALTQTGIAGEELEEKFRELEQTAGRVSEMTGVGDEDILNGLARYTQLTNDANASQQDLSIILGIASRENVNASKAAELYARALKGDTDRLKRLTPLTREQVLELNKMTDTTARAQLVTDILSDSFEGLAESISPTFLAMDNLTNAHGDLLQRMGEVIEESQVVPIVLRPITEGYRFLEKAIEDNQEAITAYIFDGVEMAIDRTIDLTAFVVENREQFAGLATSARLSVKGFQILVSTAELTYNALKAVAGVVATGLIEGFAGFLDLASTAASKLDLEMAPALAEAASRARELSDSTAEFTVDAFADGADSIDDMVARFDEMMPIIMQNDKIAGVLGDSFAKIRDRLVQARGEVQKLRTETTKASRDLDNIDNRAGGTAGAQLNAIGRGGESEKEAQSRREAAMFAELELGILREANDTKRIRLEYDKAIVEAMFADVTEAERKVMILQAEQAEQRALLDLERQRAEEAKKAREERDEEIEARIANQRAFATQLSSNLDAMAAQGDAIAGLVQLTSDLTAVQQQYGKSVEAGGKSTVAALSASGQAAATFAAAIGASAQVQAGILAVFETANAIAAFASSQYGKGAQHLAAAALYGVAAAKPNPSASGGGGGGGGAGSVPQAPSPSATGSRQDSTRDNLAEVLREALGGPQQITIIQDMRGSTLLEDSEVVGQRLTGVVKDGLQREGIDLESNRAGRRR